MGREIRKVPRNWEHPRKEDGSFQPMFDEYFDDALYNWVKEYELWKSGSHPEQDEDYPNYWEYAGGPPDPEYYMTTPKVEHTWYQVYETVSEGTPVSPPLETKQELVDYLVENSDFWDQRRGDGGWNRKAAEQFVEREWAPSGLLKMNQDGSGAYMAARDILIDDEKENSEN